MHPDVSVTVTLGTSLMLEIIGNKFKIYKKKRKKRDLLISSIQRGREGIYHSTS